MAALAEVSSDLTGTPEIGALLDEAQGYADKLDESDRANLKEMRRLWVHRAAIPKELVKERARISQALQQTWVEAKAKSDFKMFAPGFKKMMAIHKEVAAAKGAALGLSPYDAMMDEMDPGLTMRRSIPSSTILARTCRGFWPRCASGRRDGGADSFHRRFLDPEAEGAVRKAGAGGRPFAGDQPHRRGATSVLHAPFAGRCAVHHALQRGRLPLFHDGDAA